MCEGLQTGRSGLGLVSVWKVWRPADRKVWLTIWMLMKVAPQCANAAGALWEISRDICWSLSWFDLQRLKGQESKWICIGCYMQISFSWSSHVLPFTLMIGCFTTASQCPFLSYISPLTWLRSEFLFLFGHFSQASPTDSQPSFSLISVLAEEEQLLFTLLPWSWWSLACIVCLNTTITSHLLYPIFTCFSIF